MNNSTITAKLPGIQDLWPNLTGSSRIWIYQADRILSDQESSWATVQIQAFASRWASHNVDLQSRGGLLFNTFLILAVDQSHQGASGCSIDSSVHFVQELGQHLNVDFMNRMVFAAWQSDQVKLYTRDEFKQAFDAGDIHEDTAVFDNLVNTKAALQNEWIKPLKDSWHKRMI